MVAPFEVLPMTIDVLQCRTDSKKYNERRHALALFIYQSSRPVELVEEPSFVRVLKTYDPRMPSVSARQI